MNFGQALEALKVDKRIARAGWNGKGMWLRLVHSEDVRTCSDFWGEEVNADPPCLLPWIGMKTADYRFVPWLATKLNEIASPCRTLHPCEVSPSCNYPDGEPRCWRDVAHKAVEEGR